MMLFSIEGCSYNLWLSLLAADSLNLVQAYQNSASFVPKLATVVLQWLDVQKDDQILDVGCGG